MSLQPSYTGAPARPFTPLDRARRERRRRSRGAAPDPRQAGVHQVAQLVVAGARDPPGSSPARSSSSSNAPSPNTSEAASGARPSLHSGGTSGPSARRARPSVAPGSIQRASPAASISTFSGRTLACTSPAAWSDSRPAASWRAQCSATVARRPVRVENRAQRPGPRVGPDHVEAALAAGGIEGRDHPGRAQGRDRALHAQPLGGGRLVELGAVVQPLDHHPTAALVDRLPGVGVGRGPQALAQLVAAGETNRRRDRIDAPRRPATRLPPPSRAASSPGARRHRRRARRPPARPRCPLAGSRSRPARASAGAISSYALRASTISPGIASWRSRSMRWNGGPIAAGSARRDSRRCRSTPRPPRSRCAEPRSSSAAARRSIGR